MKSKASGPSSWITSNHVSSEEGDSAFSGSSCRGGSLTDRDDRARVIRGDGINAELEERSRGLGIVGDPHTQERAAGVDAIAEAVSSFEHLRDEREHPRVALACRSSERLV